MEEKYKLGFLGLGKMGSAILNGILNSRMYKKSDILVYDPNKDAYLRFMGVSQTECEEDLVTNVNTLIIAIKPQSFPSVMEKVKKISNTLSNLMVISIAAGIKIDYLKENFGDQKFVRVMPNTPAMINEASSALSRSENVSDTEFEEVKKIFRSIGIAKEIKEDQMDLVIPLNGSMPAYLYYYASLFIDKAIENGMDPDTAKELTAQAIVGSAKMILKNEKPIDELIKDVCSPGGTTIAGLDKLKEDDLKKAVDDCYDACVNRSIELGKK